MSFLTGLGLFLCFLGFCTFWVGFVTFIGWFQDYMFLPPEVKAMKAAQAHEQLSLFDGMQRAWYVYFLLALIFAYLGKAACRAA